MASPALRATLGLLLSMTMTAAASAAGDFGRAERNVFTDDFLPAMGAQRARAAGEPVSRFNLADQEVEMRDRVWRYLVAPHAYDWFGDIAVELRRTRILPASTRPAEVRLYYRWLHAERFASSRTRYNRIRQDAIDDIGMMPSAFRAICDVLEMDRQRAVAASEIAGLEAEIGADAVARKAENAQVIDWFVRAVGFRYASYSYALDHLLVETPHEEAIAANARLSDLAVYVEAAERGDFCNAADGEGSNAVVIRSRVLATAPDEGSYRK